MTPGVWCMVGNGLSNQTFVEAPDGIVAIDTGESTEEMAAALAALREHIDRPIAPMGHAGSESVDVGVDRSLALDWIQAVVAHHGGRGRGALNRRDQDELASASMTWAESGDVTDRFGIPGPATGLALRAEVLERLSSPALRVGVITAPAGYGKTSHAAACAAHDHRGVVWIDVEESHDDALVLLTDLVAALTMITDFDGDDLAGC